MDEKETKRPKKSQKEGKTGVKDKAIIAVFGALAMALLIFMPTYFAYYKPSLEQKNVELESQKIESELWVLRDAQHRAEEKIKEEKAEVADAAEVKQLEDSYNLAVEHGEKASDYWRNNRFTDAWQEIEKSREEFKKIVPIIKDVTFGKTNGLY